MHAYIPPLSFATAAVAVYHLPAVLPPSTAAAVAQISTAIGLFVLRSICQPLPSSSSTSSLQDRATKPRSDKVPRDFLWTLIYIGALAGIGSFFKDQIRTSCFKAGTAIGLLQGVIHLCTPENHPTSAPSSESSQNGQQTLMSILQQMQETNRQNDNTSHINSNHNRTEETDDKSFDTNDQQINNNNNNNNNSFSSSGDGWS